MPPYHPIFMDGWSPDYPVSDNRGLASSEQIPLSSEKRRTEEPRSHREVNFFKSVLNLNISNDLLRIIYFSSY